MEIVLAIAATAMVMCALCIGCFLVGARVGQAVRNGEPIELPTINPLEAYREHKEAKAAQAEQDRMAIIMQNIEAYDGTGYGQKDVK